MPIHCPLVDLPQQELCSEDIMEVALSVSVHEFTAQLALTPHPFPWAEPCRRELLSWGHNYLKQDFNMEYANRQTFRGRM